VEQDKNVCPHCGAILKGASPPQAESLQQAEPAGEPQRKGDIKKHCLICGKVPEEVASCPNCKLDYICRWHLYKFFQDNEKSPTGCTKCGPKCAVCGAQTTLIRFKQRAVCTSCLAVVHSSDAAQSELSRANMAKLAQFLTSFFTILGAVVGYIMAGQPEAAKLAHQLLHIKLQPFLIQSVGAIIGLVVGSFVASFFGMFLKK
jgi:hypothetical protein